tara:strand:+ start:7866 stop:8087 length:222 start_codon:yes stop_codon:yes gene_type:complete
VVTVTHRVKLRAQKSMLQLESSLEAARQVSENASARKVLDIYKCLGGPEKPGTMSTALMPQAHFQESGEDFPG